MTWGFDTGINCQLANSHRRLCIGSQQNLTVVMSFRYSSSDLSTSGSPENLSNDKAFPSPAIPTSSFVPCYPVFSYFIILLFSYPITWYPLIPLSSYLSFLHSARHRVSAAAAGGCTVAVPQRLPWDHERHMHLPDRSGPVAIYIPLPGPLGEPLPG